MSTATIEQIKEMIHDAVNSTTIDPETHKEHHEFIRMCIKREERRQEIWDKVKVHVLGWGFVAAIGLIGKAVYHFIFRNGGHI